MLGHTRIAVGLATCLAGMSGFVDAVGFLSLGGYFVSFMSGNTTRGGVALAEGSFHDVALAAGLLAAFVVGVISGSVIGHTARRQRKPAVLSVTAGVLAVSALCHSIPETHLVAPILLALAMGVENAVFERDGEVSIGLTYMTGTLVKMGQSIAHRLLGQPSTVWVRYLMLWSSMATGGILGGFGYLHFGFQSIYAAAALTLAAAVVAEKLHI